MKHYFLIILLFQMSISYGQIDVETDIDKIFSSWDKDTSPGCVVGIIKDHKFIFSKGYGLANMEYNIPNSENTVFRIASTSKQFTAACIVLLVEEGKLELDDPLKSIFPAFPDYAERITIRHLLNHTSGIRDYLQLAYLSGLSDDDYYTDLAIMKWLINQEDLNFEPGDDYLYSNSGYWLLGQIVNKLSGMNMADYAELKIFKPLGMMHTHFHNDHNQIVKNRASGYRPLANDRYEISMTKLEMIGDGGIFTTVKDIKKWDDAFYESSVLGKAFWKMMTEQGVLNNGEKIDYAAGLMIDEYKGLKTIRHAGSFVGFNAELLRFPDQKMTIVVFANTANFYASMFANQVADIAMKDYIKTEEKVNTANIKKDNFIDLTKEELEQFSGHYWNDVSSNSRKIYVKNDTLRYFRNEYSESTLMPISKNEFKMIDVLAEVLVRFDETNTMKVVVDGQRTIVLESFIPKNYTSNELSKFLGDYYSRELDVNYTVEIEDSQLMLYINKEKISNLTSIKENVFANRAYGVFKFEQDSSGGIQGFRLASGRVKNVKFHKN